MDLNNLLMLEKNENTGKKEGEDIFFEGRIKEIEQELINYQLELAKTNSQSESLQKIITTLIFHGELTQSQIKKLAILSKSTISTSLANLLNLGFVKKEKIKGSREYRYFLSSIYINSMNNALGSLENDILFFKKKLSNLRENYNSTYKGFDLVSSRLEEIIRVFNIYQKLIENVEIEKPMIKKDEKINELTSQDFNGIDELFDPKIRQIEDEIIDFFLYESVYSTMDEFVLRVFVYFLIRKIFTQKKLRDLTGLSLGKISQVVNFLIEAGMIDKVSKKKIKKIIPVDKIRQKFYSMNSIQTGFFRSGIVSGKKILMKKTEFEKLRNELISNESELRLLKGYKDVLKFLNSYFESTMVFEKLIKLFEQFC
ncbi:MAG: helix-turn-helix transcriptional regulator [archaeon]|nr:helix-turn-helix transcriptional regulator [archaeon]